ncbi:hypothetical protein GCM10027058_16900 [Microbacterium neimengense]
MSLARNLGIVAAASLGVAALRTSGAASDGPPPRSAGTISVPIGDPVQVLDLFYTRMNPDKPFPDAVLMLLDNGSYRIVSDGEDHWGSYLTDRTSAPRTVLFVSWPSADWGGDVAQHVLDFAADGSFAQHLTRPGGRTSAQAGAWSERSDPQAYGAHTPWSLLRRTER